MDGHGGPLFNKLHWWLVTSTIFIRCHCVMVRKIAELFGFNCGIRPFYTACCFDELSRGSVLCLLNTSCGTAILQCHNLVVYAKNLWPWHLPSQCSANTCPMVASRALSVAMDLVHWAVCTSLHRRIAMAIKTACKGGVLLTLSILSSFATTAKGQCFGP